METVMEMIKENGDFSLGSFSCKILMSSNMIYNYINSSFLILVCYFIFGYIYKSSVLGLSGLEAIPHPEFWSSIIEQGAENITRLWKSIVHRDSDGRGAYEQI